MSDFIRELALKTEPMKDCLAKIRELEKKVEELEIEVKKSHFSLTATAKQADQYDKVLKEIMSRANKLRFSRGIYKLAQQALTAAGKLTEDA